MRAFTDQNLERTCASLSCAWCEYPPSIGIYFFGVENTLTVPFLANLDCKTLLLATLCLSNIQWLSSTALHFVRRRSSAQIRCRQSMLPLPYV